MRVLRPAAYGQEVIMTGLGYFLDSTLDVETDRTGLYRFLGRIYGPITRDILRTN